MNVTVSSLHVQCSLQIRNFDSPGLAISDCCGLSATSAVEAPNGNLYWRCTQHRGVLSRQIGPVHTMVEKRDF